MKHVFPKLSQNVCCEDDPEDPPYGLKAGVNLYLSGLHNIRFSGKRLLQPKELTIKILSHYL